MNIEKQVKKLQNGVSWSSATDIGPVRKENEDSYAVIEPLTFVIADGMGGYAAGEVASGILTNTAEEMLSGAMNVTELSLKQVISQANKKVIEETVRNPERQGMGTTATLCHISGKEVFWAHVGDSKLYLLHDNKLRQITKDHTYANLLIERGEATPEEAAENTSGKMLTRAVGVEDAVFADAGCFEVEKGDMLILCTDGLSGKLSEDNIADILMGTSVPDERAGSLVRAALNQGTRDNVTVIVVEITENC